MIRPSHLTINLGNCDTPCLPYCFAHFLNSVFRVLLLLLLGSLLSLLLLLLEVNISFTWVSVYYISASLVILYIVTHYRLDICLLPFGMQKLNVLVNNTWCLSLKFLTPLLLLKLFILRWGIIYLYFCSVLWFAIYI